ncbi:uncharacterized protein N7511_008521 [Penicillium nucicola]|uniref:uncharacterized protein n=1 Tax=Penicillium nucicola TaxID=1850975 RepID=UPI002544DCB6|nr:uncharacterized protein N7511_011576 [Penicillium nucicola]XP_056978430.1 uncharacterized protein N7511_011550 [Penicillium nucicola]XP_056981629.1 uncharacterized protein N7511_008521 [Penicillium nucicola]KAJ5741204.1 hypothetical protein N7511_011576 [Penicillium nucicola]KAJ5742364.1 hypothetical protein N7511_011550 [Penicillium nucicola]KAJ5751556.1 hypothetical protein N7511_008521 [Penicillium nucicola]
MALVCSQIGYADLLWFLRSIATSCAAPLVFEPVNGLQDGAFAANCPAWVAMMELNELSMLGSRLLDYSVSFGTGRFLCPDKSRSRRWIKHLVPEWVSRLGCGLGSVVDADSMYGKFSSALNRAERDGKHYRVEPSLRKPPIALDDAAFLADLITETEQYMESPQVQQSISHLQLAMLASCFYAALLSPPTFNSNVGQYCVQLAVLSRWPEDGDIYTPIDIGLTVDGITSHPISGAPLSLMQLMYLQHPPFWSHSTARKRDGSHLADSCNKRRRTT